MASRKEKLNRTIVTLGENAKDKKMTRKVDLTEYESMATCIKTDQVSPELIAEYFEDKPFLRWFQKKYR